VSDVLEHVEARDALRGQELRRVRLVLLKRGREHVPGLHLLTTGALHVEHRRLEDAAEGEGLFRLFLLAASELLDRVLQVLVEVLAKLRQVGAAGGEDPFAVGIVRERVEQVFEREVGVPPRARLPIGDSQNDFECWTEHVVLNSCTAVIPAPSPPAMETRSRARAR
jgi:hypothetical protein